MSVFQYFVLSDACDEESENENLDSSDDYIEDDDDDDDDDDEDET